MSYSVKFNIFDGFSKGFFGGTMMGVRRPMPAKFKPSELKFDSVDDFNNYFHRLMATQCDTVNLSKKRNLETADLKK